MFTEWLEGLAGWTVAAAALALGLAMYVGVVVVGRSPLAVSVQHGVRAALVGAAPPSTASVYCPEGTVQEVCLAADAYAHRTGMAFFCAAGDTACQRGWSQPVP